MTSLGTFSGRGWRHLLVHPWSLGLLGILLVFGLWATISSLGVVDRLFLPSPAAVLAAGQEELAQGQLVADLVASVRRVFGGFALSALVEVGAFYWTVLAPDIVNPGREEQGSVSV